VHAGALPDTFGCSLEPQETAMPDSVITARRRLRGFCVLAGADGAVRLFVWHAGLLRIEDTDRDSYRPVRGLARSSRRKGRPGAFQIV
jgi:hypothetical protein